MHSMFFNKKIALILLLFISIFGYVVFSDLIDTRYTEFYFMSGVNNTTTMSVDLIGGVTGYVDFHLENYSDTSFPVNMSFVDSQIVNYGSTGVRVCLSDNEKENFGQYVSMDNSSFSVTANTGVTEQLKLSFPAWYSGLYYGCVVYTPNITESTNYLNTLPRKAIFLDVNVDSTYKDLDIVVRPVFRENDSDGYGFSGADFWMFTYVNGNWETVYNSFLSGDDKINTDENGYGKVSLLPPTDGTQYLVAFKGSGSLSIGYTGIWDDTIDGFNMFSGSIANTLSTNFIIRYDNGIETGNYLKMGDIAASNSGNYDLIKDADFALMTSNLSTILNPTHIEWFDLDGNKIINSLEQTMLTDAYSHIGFISLQNYIPLTGFVNI